MAEYVMTHMSEDETREDTFKKFAFGYRSREQMNWIYIDAYIYNEKSIGNNARILKK